MGGLLCLCVLASVPTAPPQEGEVVTQSAPADTDVEAREPEAIDPVDVVGRVALAGALMGVGAMAFATVFAVAALGATYLRFGTVHGTLYLPIGPVDTRLYAVGAGAVGVLIGAQAGLGATAFLLSE